jgi:hypothetical protein
VTGLTRKRTPYAHLPRRDRPAELVAVANAADRFARSRFELHDAICDAYSEGQSLRAIAEASGIYSHEQVRRIVSHEQGRRMVTKASRTYSHGPTAAS